MKTPGTTFRYDKQFIAVVKEAAAIDGITMTAWVHDAITDKLRNDAEWYAVPLEMLRGTGKDETEVQNEQGTV
jgi:nitrate reductase assembly molybdenum cofactor insertion protein NarJ